ncbi:MAG: DNA-binding MarR family transcriptional regulator [Patescibacteria group bacterium]
MDNALHNISIHIIHDTSGNTIHDMDLDIEGDTISMITRIMMDDIVNNIVYMILRGYIMKKEDTSKTLKQIRLYIKRFGSAEHFSLKILNSVPGEIKIVRSDDFHTLLSMDSSETTFTLEEKTALSKVISSMEPQSIITVSRLGNKDIQTRTLFTPIIKNGTEVAEIICYSNDITDNLVLTEQNIALEKRYKMNQSTALSRAHKKIAELEQKYSAIPLKETISPEFKVELISLQSENRELKEHLKRSQAFESSPSMNTKRVRGELSPNEQKVLTAICTYPLASDDELSEMIAVKRSTLTAIKNRLLKQRYYTVLFIPNLYALQCENFTLIQADLIRGIKRLPAEILDHPELLLALSSHKAFIALFSSLKYADCELFNSKLSQSLHNEIDSDINRYVSLSEVDSLEVNTFTDILHGIFPNVNSTGLTTVTHDFSRTSVTLNNNAKRILFEFIRTPELNITHLAKKIWLSKPTVIKNRKYLLENKIIIPYAIPNFEKLGLSYFSIITITFSAKKPTVFLDAVDAVTLLRISKPLSDIRVILSASKDIANQVVRQIEEAYDSSSRNIDIRVKHISTSGFSKLKKINLSDITEKLLFQ